MRYEKGIIFLGVSIIGVMVYFSSFMIDGAFPYGADWRVALWYQIVLALFVILVFVIAYKKPRMPFLLALALTLPHWLAAFFFTKRVDVSGCSVCFSTGMSLIFIAPFIILAAYILLKIFTKIILKIRQN
ncbi:MAG: hypothetical protein HOE19_02200 [Candidatus Komeilibacteria bacterium]|jgi:hypothetical protein|nr:hypothetical protein [Candidatus Komeilibacteria bacterium]MBT4447196.1 hypothetical protein [Candidatus Komeilibacteria bacterium]